MKRSIKILLSVLFLVIIVIGWIFFGPTIANKQNQYFYIKTGSNYEEVKKSLIKEGYISNGLAFDFLSSISGYKRKIKPGRYLIKNGTSLYKLISLLQSGKQSDIRLVLTKLRTKEELASKIGKNFEADSTEVIRFLLSNDSLAPYHLDTNTVMSIIIPNTYRIWWDGNFGKIFKRLAKQHDLFWEGNRAEKAKKIGLQPIEVYTLASIVEEETNKKEDKGKIASVYLNRLHKNMKLEADPTVKYSIRNFELKRILNTHLQFASPYNTYKNTGLPPGPICTPSIYTIDAVLEAPATNYIFFVAKPDFSGYSNFSETYEQHLVYARAYQKALDSLMKK